MNKNEIEKIMKDADEYTIEEYKRNIEEEIKVYCPANSESNQKGEVFVIYHCNSEKVILESFKYLKKKENLCWIQFLLKLRKAKIDFMLEPIIRSILNDAEENFDVLLHLEKLPKNGYPPKDIVLSAEIGCNIGGIDHNEVDYEEVYDAAKWIANITGHRVVIKRVKEKEFPMRQSPDLYEFFQTYNKDELSELGISRVKMDLITQKHYDYIDKMIKAGS